MWEEGKTVKVINRGVIIRLTYYNDIKLEIIFIIIIEN